jgi:hypothetical protein
MRLHCEELLHNIEVMEREISKNSQKITKYDKVFIINFKYLSLFMKFQIIKN